MLGLILAPLGQEVPGQYPNEIAYSYGGSGGANGYLCPFDPQWNTRDQQGMYFDSMLGGPAIPTDAELATVYGRTPVASAWIRAKEGFFPSPWRVPGGWNPAGAWGPPMSLSGSSGFPSAKGWALAILAGGAAWWFLRKKKRK